MSETRVKISFVENTLNILLTLGVSPPTASSAFISLFEGRVTKEELLQFFQTGQINWIKGMSSDSYEDYKRSMNEAAIRILTR